MIYFGRKQPAPAWDYATLADTPVGQPCLHCAEPIIDGDSGVIVPFIRSRTEATEEPYHVDCWLRQTIGGLAHVEGRCSCHGGSVDPDDAPGMTLRQSASAAVAEFRARYL